MTKNPRNIIKKAIHLLTLCREKGQIKKETAGIVKTLVDIVDSEKPSDSPSMPMGRSIAKKLNNMQKGGRIKSYINKIKR